MHLEKIRAKINITRDESKRMHLDERTKKRMKRIRAIGIAVN